MNKIRTLWGMFILVSIAFFWGCSSLISSVSTDNLQPTPQLQTPPWNDITVAKHSAEELYHVEHLILVDIVGSYFKTVDMFWINFTFMDSHNTIYTITMTYKQQQVTYAKDETTITKVENGDIRKKLIPLVAISPVTVLEMMQRFAIVDHTCFDKPINFGIQIPQENSNVYPTVYWRFTLNRCENQHITVNINAQNGELLDLIRR